MLDFGILGVYNESMIKNPKALERVNYHLRVDQHDALRKLSNETGVSVATYIRMAVDKLLKGMK